MCVACAHLCECRVCECHVCAHLCECSWWYPKGPDGGVTTWLAEASVFPDGLDYVFNQTGWPIQVGRSSFALPHLD